MKITKIEGMVEKPGNSLPAKNEFLLIKSTGK